LLPPEVRFVGENASNSISVVLGAIPQTPLGEITAPRPPSWLLWALLLRQECGEWTGERGKGVGKGREWKGRDPQGLVDTQCSQS